MPCPNARRAHPRHPRTARIQRGAFAFPVAQAILFTLRYEGPVPPSPRGARPNTWLSSPTSFPALAFAGSLDFVADAFRRANDGAPNTLHSGAEKPTLKRSGTLT